MSRRLEALQEIGFKLALEDRVRHFMIVISIRHRRGAEWKVLVEALRKMQAAVRRGHPWRNAVIGFVRLLESTYRHANGHHPHEHILLSIRASEDFAPDAFFDWVEKTCKRIARRDGRSCDFHGRWWSEIPREGLGKALGYFGKAEKMGTSCISESPKQSNTLPPDDPGPLIEFSTSSKHQPLWCIPPLAYSEVWRTSYRLRWFGTGGVWRTEASAKTNEELDQEREATGIVIAHIPRNIWLSWDPKLRREVRAMVADRALRDTEVVERVVSYGGAAGPPPALGWGDSDN